VAWKTCTSRVRATPYRSKVMLFPFLPLPLSPTFPLNRSVVSLQNEKSKLAAKVEEIQWRLSAEKKEKQMVEREKEELAKLLDETKEKHAHELIEAKKKYHFCSSFFPSSCLLYLLFFVSLSLPPFTT
jgi:hypothetical protein